jgi:mediator of replication checkpoint protein 1
MEPEGFVEKPPPLDHPVPNAGVLGLDMNEELPSVDDLISHSVQQWVKGKGKAVDDLHSIEDVLPRCGPSADKGKGKAIEESQSSNAKSNKTHFTRGPLRVIGLANSSKHQCTLDSDSELEILPVTVKSRKLDIFDRLPPQKITDQGRSLRTLRVLANLTSPGKKTDKAKGSMTPAEMHMSLQRTARQQAAKERAEKLQDLKDRGIMVQTAEERQRDQADIEDLLEKARREADELKKKEKDGTKKERHADGQGELTDSSDEDEDYRDAEDEAQGDGLDVELSGSEEEELDEMEDEEAEGEEEGEMELADGQSNHMTVIDNEATEDQAEEPMDREDVEDEIEDEDLDENVPILQHKRRSKITRVIDEEEDEIEGISSPPARKPASVVNPFIPSLTGSDEAPMGLTQAFAATLGDSESQKDGETFAVEQDSLDFLRATPVREFAMPDSMPLDLVVTDSQAGHSAWQRQTQGLDIDLHVSQSQIDHDTMLTTATQYSDIPDPTQDAGFQLSPPLPDRFASPPPSTIDTVPLHRASPVVKKKGRLRSRAEAIATFSDEDLPASDADDADEFTTPANAFDVMKKANQKPAVRVESFDKKKSDAKRMVEEQAEESEDEYAGLGGASDDDSGAEDDEEVRKMIDEGDVEVDERKLAAFYAYVVDASAAVDLY